MNRRGFLGLGLGAAAAASAPVRARGSTPAAPELRDGDDEPLPVPRRSLDRAYSYLGLAMDAYRQRRSVRLLQSYADSQQLGSTGFVYDNSLAVLAFLARAKGDDVGRAMLLGDSLIYAQAHDPAYDDGRVRQAYWVGPFSLPFTSNDAYFVRPDGSVNLVGAPWFFQGSSTSDMCWVGIALAQLFARTRKRRYLEGALRLGEWIVAHAYDTTGLGGYSFGVDGNDQPLHSKLSEHNADVYGFFTHLLAPLSGDNVWIERAEHALRFLERLWNPDGGYFFTGSEDGATVDRQPVLEEVQSEGYLALGDARFGDALDWVKTNLIATDTPQSRQSRLSGNLRLFGVTFSDQSRRLVRRAGASDPLPDPDAVWLEGTAHMVAALLARRRSARDDLPTFHGDRATAAAYAAQITLAQAELGRAQAVGGVPVPDGSGIVAASSVLNTGTGFSYFPNLHVGATSWFLLAAQERNPYRP